MRGCPDVDRLKAYMPDQASTIIDHRGREVGKLFLTRSIIVSIDSLPEYVPNAFIAMEDKRFWEHNGIDWHRVFGAAYRNIKAFGVREGSSTITMQLARNIFPDRLPMHQRTMLRKFAEARVARAIERKYSKQEILSLYLNQIYFGNGAYGIEAAAQEYFGKHAKELALSQAAMLAALPRAPSRMNPRNDRELALQGRKTVLQRMVDQKLITREEADKADHAKLRLRHGNTRANQPAPYFVEAVRQVLEEQLGDVIYTEGLTIYTTLDIALQRTLEQELAAQLRAIESGAYGTFRHTTYAMERADTSDDDSATRYLQTAAVFMDTRTGDVRALVGGRSFDDSEYNRALYAQRQPGSAFKPFVYAAAFESGYSPTYRLIDQPLRMVLSRRNVWEPKNYDGSYSGAVSLRDALTHSKNVPTIRLANEIGISHVIDVARQMGLRGRIPAVPSVVLGTAEVTPLDLTATFAAFATLGERPTPRFVTKVVDGNGVELWSQPSEMPRQVLDPAVAFMTVSLMEDVVNRGTAASVRAVGYRQPAAGKTGTTNDAGDIWFIGFTPDLVGGIWIGFDRRKTILARATGGELAAPVWGRVMRRTGQRSGGWAPPPGVEMRMVDENGNAVSENCPAYGPMRREYFLLGSAPFATCYAPYDSTWYDSMYAYPDTLSESDESWWKRMRKRLFGDEARDTLPQEPVDTVRGLPAPVQPVEPDPPKPVPFDSIRPKPDTIPEPDTTTSEPDTLRVPR